MKHLITLASSRISLRFTVLITSGTIRVNEKLNNEIELVLEDMGLTITSAFTIFAKAVINQNKIPFDIASSSFGQDSKEQKKQSTDEKNNKRNKK